MIAQSTSAPAVQPAFDGLRAAFLLDGGLTLDQRRGALKALRRSLIDHADAYVAAIDADFRGRSRHETLLTEVVVVLSAIDDTLPRLKRWAAAKKIRLGFPFWPAAGEIRPQPRGVAGIVAPSNYPLQLTLMPLIGALSAGCRTLIKPSELTPRTADLIASHLGKTFDPSVVAVVTGDAEVARAVTELPLDLLLFTGSSRVGAVVAQAAARQMTPVILELGGKSPVVIDRSADLDMAAQSIMAGKLINAGQTCVAPDYVLVPRESKDALIAALRRAAASLYPQPENGDYSAIGSDRALSRQHDLENNQRVIPLFDAAVAAPRHTPKVIDAPSPDSAVMQEEIFGPLLPVIAYDDIEEATATIRGLPSALVIYWFGEVNDRLDALISRTQSGAVSINETVLYAGISALPFGGIGPSGWGRYHGKAGFDSFSHERVLFRQPRWNIAKMMRPPFGTHADGILKLLLRNK
ncbi:aldehyde dehydrogenase family protein [Tardiphaga sp. vice352]|uniref:aldehyde dehydrogenase family protein n=1 Tax=unclassified Tardiphaga TaxID=2631404 RepID=UPI0011638AAD|nr:MULTISPECIES: aldehyde dehydrogenase family protein [unclassified Tardiphaga]QDM16601.1 aldehyde dehydrogenase family protein [Tardiphaga sp. vice278]QDM26811.1 aldehyde dehydrogenase family protein [Tardiphaga sp. vice304]QDM31875.1 aldehyde dehydrogenase family protein [Tardiphaga sp. vice352]